MIQGNTWHEYSNELKHFLGDQEHTHIHFSV